ncbi:EAL domain-containing protein [Cohnella hongkongensis]|uniref:EAL domain-containing protein n=1 Tax=Cohnella hongkongensis TaxID=178337 RepID=A0ABV9FLI5_9BACL
MSRYHRASSSAPLRDAGLVEFAAEEPDLREALQRTIGELAAPDEACPPLAMRYLENGQLLRLMSRLQRRLPSGDAGAVRCRIRFSPDREAEDEPGTGHPATDLPETDDPGDSAWFPLAELFGDIGGVTLPDYILHRHFTVYMQPIVKSGREIAGYEFLTRPLPEQAPFRPAELFETARRIGQHSFLDRAARQLAIRMGAAHLPRGTKRFVNFLPSSLYRPESCLRCTFDAIKETGTDPEDCVFEVMESEPLDDPALSSVFDLYRREGVRLALDDAGTGYATIDAVERLRPDYVKIDRKWVSRCDEDPVKQRYIDDLLNRVSRFRGVVLAEGVERSEEWAYLKRAGVPLYQGFLFGRAVPVPPLTPAPIG